MDEKKVVIEINDATSPLDEGDTAHIYFKAEQNGAATNYDCRVLVLHIRVQGEKALVDCEVLTVGNNQRRNFLRFEPKPGQVSVCRAWVLVAGSASGSSAGPPQGGAGHGSGRSSGSASGRWHALPTSGITVRDMSAGGALLDMERGLAASAAHNAVLVLHMALYSTSEAAQEIFLAGKVVRRRLMGASGADAENGGYWRIGTQWLRWTQSLTAPGRSQWREIAGNEGVLPLALWVVRHNARETMVYAQQGRGTRAARATAFSPAASWFKASGPTALGSTAFGSASLAAFTEGARPGHGRNEQVCLAQTSQITE